MTKKELIEISNDLNNLDNIVLSQDVPHPTIPEYVELHDSINLIRHNLYKLIDKYELKLKEVADD